MAYTKKELEQIERIQKGLKCSYEQACDVFECDKEIDKGIAQDFDLTKEQEKIAKSFAHTTSAEKKTTPTVYKFDQRERKADTTKENVIQEIFEFLTEKGYESVEILNKSKLISFKIGQDTYEFDLKRKRNSKK